MSKFTMYILVFILITGSELNIFARAGLCNPIIGPCSEGSCMPCDLEKKQSVNKNDCMNPNGCPEVTKVKLEPPVPDYLIKPSIILSNPITRCLLCFWNITPFYWNMVWEPAKEE
uniref:Uncharacterized protein n=1 Tax=Schizaphis graminum TaxID=13262 RepID=A0A2S2P3L1_SCHGA